MLKLPAHILPTMKRLKIRILMVINDHQLRTLSGWDTKTQKEGTHTLFTFLLRMIYNVGNAKAQIKTGMKHIKRNS